MGHSQMLLSEAFKKKKKIEKKLFRFSTEQSQLKHQLKCINVEQREREKNVLWEIENRYKNLLSTFI